MADVVLSLLVLKTRQIDALRKMYGTLGIELTEEKHGKGPVHYSGRIGDMILEIYPLPTGDTPVDATTRLGFVVESLSKIVKALEKQGISIVTKPTETERELRAIVRDPDGRVVELHER